MAAAVLLWGGGAGLRAETIRVPADQPTVQAGIDAAREGDTVLVTAGVYEGPGNREIDFLGKAIAVRSESGAARTVIDCRGEGRGFDFHSGEGPGSILSGFTVRGGVSDRGAGARCVEASSPTIEDCSFLDGTADGGGGLFCGDGSSPLLRRCLFRGNSSTFGGGVECDGASPSFSDCELSGNSATSGGAFHCQGGAAPTLDRCALAGNAASYGGGIYCDGSSPALSDSAVRGNLATTAGAGLFLFNGSSPSLRGCVVEGNGAGSKAGGMCCLESSSPTLENCLITGNSAQVGGGVSCETVLDRPTLANCTLFGNLARSLNGGVNCEEGAAPRLLNSIIWGNREQSLCGEISYCLSDEDPRFLRPGTFDFDRFVTVEVAGVERRMPDFVVEAGDYHLPDSSPGVDSGTDEGAPEVDREGRPRPCGPGFDLGAYELCSGPPGPFRRADVNGDSKQDLSDAVFALDFLFLGGPAPACLKSIDSDDSGREDLSDAIYLLTHLFIGGPAPPLPYPACGTDPTPDSLTCATNPSCP